MQTVFCTRLSLKRKTENRGIGGIGQSENQGLGESGNQGIGESGKAAVQIPLFKNWHGQSLK